MATLILPFTGAEVTVVDEAQVERFVAAGWTVKQSRPAAKKTSK